MLSGHLLAHSEVLCHLYLPRGLVLLLFKMQLKDQVTKNMPKWNQSMTNNMLIELIGSAVVQSLVCLTSNQKQGLNKP